MNADVLLDFRKNEKKIDEKRSVADLDNVSHSRLSSENMTHCLSDP